MPDRTFQFGVFEVNAASGELRKNGTRIKLQEQPFQILLLLLNRPGEIVGREEIRSRLWSDNTFVDFDNAISSAVRKLREALNDNADTPRFIETVARRGYRFIGPLTPSPAIPKPERKSINAIPIAAGALLILGVASWWFWHPQKPNPASLTPLPLTAASGLEGHGSFSPDGNQMAYSWDETGTGYHSHIYVKLIGSGRSMQLTTSSRPDFFPAWSPDGRDIAFFRSLDQRQAMYLISPVGGAERKIADGYFYGPGFWSPDGRFLVVSDRGSPNGNASLYLLNPENGNRLRLTTQSDAVAADNGPVFSPDGRTLLFVRCREQYTCGLYLLDLSAGYRPKGPPRLLRDGNGNIRGTAWTADGKDVVYALSSDAGLNFHLMRMRVAKGAEPERLSYTGEHLFGVAISPRGNRLAYTQRFFDRDIWQVRLGKPPRSFASSTRDDSAAQYSPDGKQVAFQSTRSGQIEIWLCDADGGNTVQLTNFAEASGSPHWSPDGHWIAFDRQLKKGWHIFVMASDGGQARQLNSDDGDEFAPNWSRDGNWVYYGSNRSGRFEIWKAPAKGGTGIQMTRAGGWFAAESPDGNFLYYTKNLDGRDGLSDLWTLPAHGGEEQLIVKSIVSRPFDVREDGIYYFFGTLGAGGSASVRFHDFATGKEQEIAPIKNGAGWLAVSPDRKTFLFSVWSRIGANIMVVDNFH
jgi:Tol biopolymer transport system component/DNA-binding winged helix-turn-helix (wHTH) protein